MTIRDQNGKPIRAMHLRLWSVNRWLRWTGWRLFVGVGENEPTIIGLVWYGWRFVGHEKGDGSCGT